MSYNSYYYNPYYNQNRLYREELHELKTNGHKRKQGYKECIEEKERHISKLEQRISELEEKLKRVKKHRNQLSRDLKRERKISDEMENELVYQDEIIEYFKSLLVKNEIDYDEDYCNFVVDDFDEESYSDDEDFNDEEEYHYEGEFYF